MSLSTKQIKQFRAIGHRLKPVVTVSGGLGDNVLAETARALSDHELIKVKINAEDRELKKLLVEELCAQSGAELVQLIGNVALIYRPARTPDPRLSNLLRHKELLD